jgi:hypothetical protein
MMKADRTDRNKPHGKDQRGPAARQCPALQPPQGNRKQRHDHKQARNDRLLHEAAAVKPALMKGQAAARGRAGCHRSGQRGTAGFSVCLWAEKESLFQGPILEGLITTFFVELMKATDSPRFGHRMTRTLIIPGPADRARTAPCLPNAGSVRAGRRIRTLP